MAEDCAQCCTEVTPTSREPCRTRPALEKEIAIAGVVGRLGRAPFCTRAKAAAHSPNAGWRSVCVDEYDTLVRAKKRRAPSTCHNYQQSGGGSGRPPRRHSPPRCLHWQSPLRRVLLQLGASRCEGPRKRHNLITSLNAAAPVRDCDNRYVTQRS